MKSFIYLLIDPEEVHGIRAKYVGLTTDGIWRFENHLKGIDGVRCRQWIMDLQSRNRVPFHVVLQEAPSLKELQVLEIGYIRVLTLMGESLLNQTQGGEPGTGRRFNPDPNLTPYTAAEVEYFRTIIRQAIRPPTENIFDVIGTMQRVTQRLGGFQEELEKLIVNFAFHSLFTIKPVQPLVIEPVKVVPPKKKRTESSRRCEVPGCTKGRDGGPGPHHSYGLCQSHADKERLKKKAAKLATQVAISVPEKS